MLIYENIMKYVSFMDDLCQGGIIISFTTIKRLGSTKIRKMSAKKLLRCLCKYCKIGQIFSEAVTEKAHVMAKLALQKDCLGSC